MRTILNLSICAIILCSCNNNADNSATTDTGAIKSSNTSNEPTALKPAGAKPEWGPGITDPMQVVIEKLVSYGAPPIPTLSAQEARKQPSPATAVMDIIKEKNIVVPPPAVDTMGKDINVAGGKIHIRIYTPKTGDSTFPVIVYYHGGGWVIADLDTYDASASALAEQTGAVLVSVHYRQAPEFKFPTAHNDCYAAYQWVLKNATSIKGDPKRVAVVGESAGGNLAASVAMMARDKGVMMPVHQVLIYPIANYDVNSASYQKYASAKPLDKPMMLWFFDKYLKDSTQGNNPMISLVKANLKNLPSATIITAEIDPLQDDGKLLADKLKAAGVNVTYKNYDGVTHEFFGMAAILPEAKEAQALAASELKKAFNK